MICACRLPTRPFVSAAFDIETTGLKRTDTITCVAIAGDGWSWSWHMGPGYNHEETKEQIKNQLDWATILYAFNGATFDLPFMQRFFGYSDEDVGRWMRKLVDPLYAARALLGYEACAKLSAVLELNGLPPKCGSGANAIDLARDHKWEELAEYCTGDAALTHRLMELRPLRWPHGLLFDAGSIGMWASEATGFQALDPSESGA